MYVIGCVYNENKSNVKLTEWNEHMQQFIFRT